MVCNYGMILWIHNFAEANNKTLYRVMLYCVVLYDIVVYHIV